jgi:hypothetical protein
MIFASDAFKANPQLFLDALAAPVAALPEAPASAPEPSAPAPEPSAPAPELKRPPTAWNVLVDQTVRDMRQNGWAAFTDVEGTLWPASRSEGDKHVYSDGKYAGKEASRAAGGFKLASLRNSESKPEAAAAALARVTHREEVKAARRAALASLETALAKPAEDSDASSVAPMTATKPCRSCKHELPLEAFQKGERVLKCCDTCREKQNVRSAERGHNDRNNAAAKAARHARKAAAALVLDAWHYNGKELLKNERNDVLTSDGEWVGRWNGFAIVEGPEPADFETLTTRD